jgi:hypothetical protein
MTDLSEGLNRCTERGRRKQSLSIFPTLIHLKIESKFLHVLFVWFKFIEFDLFIVFLKVG